MKLLKKILYGYSEHHYNYVSRVMVCFCLFVCACVWTHVGELIGTSPSGAHRFMMLTEDKQQQILAHHLGASSFSQPHYTITLVRICSGCESGLSRMCKHHMYTYIYVYSLTNVMCDSCQLSLARLALCTCITVIIPAVFHVPLNFWLWLVIFNNLSQSN